METFISDTLFLAIGDNCLDVYSDRDVATVGGNAVNVAVGWHRRGLTGRYLGAVANDEEGRIIVHALTGIGVQVDGVEVCDGATGVTVLKLNDGDRVMHYEDFGVGLQFDVREPVLAAELENAAWVHIAGVDPALGLVERAVALGARVSVDLATSGRTDGLQGVEIAFASWTPQSGFSDREIASGLLAAGCRVAVVTSGALGSLSLSRDHEVRQAAQKIVPIDTCGAGDSFISTYVSEHVAGMDVLAALQSATDAATATCLHLGGWPQAMNDIPADIREASFFVSARENGLVP